MARTTLHERARARVVRAANNVELDRFTDAYIEAMLWSTNDESDESGGEPLDKNYSSSDLTPDSLKKIEAESASFWKTNRTLIENDSSREIDQYGAPSLAGHDFWLTRGGHGAGFWDGGWPKNGEALTKASKKYGEAHVYVENGEIHYESSGLREGRVNERGIVAASSKTSEFAEFIEKSVILIAGDEGSVIDPYAEKVHVAVAFDVTSFSEHQAAIYVDQNRFHANTDEALQNAVEILEDWLRDKYGDNEHLGETIQWRTWTLPAKEFCDAIHGTRAEKFIFIADENEDLDERSTRTVAAGRKKPDGSVSMYQPAETYINGKYQVSGTISPSHGIEYQVEQVLHITPMGGLIEIKQDGNTWAFIRDDSERGYTPKTGRAREGRVNAHTGHIDNGNEQYVPFHDWRELMNWAKKGAPLAYKAPMDRHPTMLKPGHGIERGYEARGRTIRIWPPGSVGRGRNRTADPFNADSSHLDRFFMPTHIVGGRVLEKGNAREGAPVMRGVVRSYAAAPKRANEMNTSRLWGPWKNEVIGHIKGASRTSAAKIFDRYEEEMRARFRNGEAPADAAYELNQRDGVNEKKTVKAARPKARRSVKRKR